jgi:nucleotide-binding universal stress UspA family protein
MAKQQVKTSGKEIGQQSLWHKILVPVDFSPCSQAALAYALRLAAVSGEGVDVCHVIPLPHVLDLFYEPGFAPPHSVEVISKKGRKWIREIAAPFTGEVKKLRLHFVEGEPQKKILELAEKLRPDLIVIGTYGRRGVRRFLLGSVAETVVRRAPCPVLTLREAGKSVEAGESRKVS